MPIYEYVCKRCGRVSSILVLPPEDPRPVCRYCGSGDMERIISKVRVRCSEETRLEKASDPSFWGGLDESDPKSVYKAFDRLGSLVGDGLDDDFSSMKEDLEASMEEASQEDTEGAEDEL